MLMLLLFPMAVENAFISMDTFANLSQKLPTISIVSPGVYDCMYFF